MEKGLSGNDRIIVDRLLSRLVDRLGGALDFWTLVCLQPIVPDPRRFLLENSDKLQSLVVVAQMILAEAHLANEAPIAGLIERLTGACQELRRVFLVLEQFRGLSSEELGTETRALASTYKEIIESVRLLGETLDLELACWQGRTPEREAYYQSILDYLFERFSEWRESGAAVVSSTSNNH
jgi:hypothetical protein